MILFYSLTLCFDSNNGRVGRGKGRKETEGEIALFFQIFQHWKDLVYIEGKEIKSF